MSLMDETRMGRAIEKVAKTGIKIHNTDRSMATPVVASAIGAGLLSPIVGVPIGFVIGEKMRQHHNIARKIRASKEWSAYPTRYRVRKGNIELYDNSGNHIYSEPITKHAEDTKPLSVTGHGVIGGTTALGLGVGTVGTAGAIQDIRLATALEAQQRFNRKRLSCLVKGFPFYHNDSHYNRLEREFQEASSKVGRGLSGKIVKGFHRSPTGRIAALGAVLAGVGTGIGAGIGAIRNHK